MLKNYLFMLKSAIKKCKTLSKKNKRIMFKLIREKYSLKGLNSKRDLFYSMMEARTYDLYTSSILLLIQKNPTSLNTLVRGQLENLGLLEYLLKNPKDFEVFFKGSLEVNYPKELKKIREDLGKWWGDTGDYVHPDMEGLKVVLTDTSEVIPKDPDYKFNKKDKFSKEEFKEKFNLIPSIFKEAIPHNKIRDKDFNKIVEHLISLYLACITRLEDLYKILPNSEIEDMKEVWKKYNQRKPFI